MKQHVSTLGYEVVAVIADGGDHGLYGFLAEFLGAMLRSLVEELKGIRSLAAGCRAGVDNFLEVMEREMLHHFNSTSQTRDGNTHAHGVADADHPDM